MVGLAVVVLVEMVGFWWACVNFLVKLRLLTTCFIKVRRRGREVEGTPLLREHAGKTCIEGSNPSVSARNSEKPVFDRIETPPSACYAGFSVSGLQNWI